MSMDNLISKYGVWIAGANLYLSDAAKAWKKDLKGVGIRHRSVEFSDFGLEVLICVGRISAKKSGRHWYGPKDVDISREAEVFASEYFQDSGTVSSSPIWRERYMREGLNFPDSALSPDLFKMMPLIAFVEWVLRYPSYYNQAMGFTDD